MGWMSEEQVPYFLEEWCHYHIRPTTCDTGEPFSGSMYLKHPHFRNCLLFILENTFDKNTFDSIALKFIFRTGLLTRVGKEIKSSLDKS